MTPPKHLWSGDWRRESEDAAREQATTAFDHADTAVAPEAAPLTRPEVPTQAITAPRRGQAPPPPPPPGPKEPRSGNGRRWIAVGAVGVVLVGSAFAAGALLDGSGGSETNTTAALPSVANAPIKPPKGVSRAAAIYAKVSPGVVSIRTNEGSGTGFLVDGKGTIVTNAHVVDTSKQVVVRFGSKGRILKGRVAGTDPSVDLAVVKLAPSDVPAGAKPLGLADSRAVRVGDDVIAIGNPFGLDRTETTGIVSAVGRDIQAPNRYSISEAIQTDAAINPGNSGGPLLNTSGDVIGVNSQIETGGGGSNGNVGIGFAVPSNAVRQVVPALSKGQTVAHPWLGVSVGQATDGTGALLGSIVAGGPAADAGLRVGDVVESIDGKPVNDSTDLVQIVNGDRVGQTLELKVRRAGKQVTVKVTVGTRPKTSATTSGGGTTP